MHAFVSPAFPASLKRPRRKVTVSSPVIACQNGLPQPPRRPSPAPALSLAAIAVTTAIALPLLTGTQPAIAKNLLTENTIFRRYLVTDSSAILRYSLPLPSERQGSPERAPIRLVQESLERLGVHLRARGAAGLIAGRRDLGELSELLSQRQLDILLDVPAKRRQEAADKLAELSRTVSYIKSDLGSPTPLPGTNFLPPAALRVEQTLQDALTPRNSIKRVTNYDAAYLESLRQQALEKVADIEEIAVEGSGLPFRIPRRYNSLPRLTGRARVQFTLHKKDGTWNLDGSSTDQLATTSSDAKMVAVLDGYSAPLTAGNFFDLVQRGYYNKTRVLANQRDFFAQLGEREDDDHTGFRDPSTGTRRSIPLEILADGEPSPAYGATLDDLGIGDLQPVLPVQAYGALAMVHSVEDPNDASSQFYFFMLEPTSYTARSFGGSVLTGSLATFGYVVEGQEVLNQIQKGDELVSVKVISGEENFKQSG